MTPEQLRSLAARRRAEAAELHTDAARLRSQAELLTGLLDPLVPISQRVWRGPAAIEFENQVRVHAGRVNEQAQLLESVAADFDRIAGKKEQEDRQLRAQADALEPIVVPGGVM